MHSPLPRPIRAHGRRLVVVLATVAVVLCSLARPTGASAAPVDLVQEEKRKLQPEPRVVRAVSLCGPDLVPFSRAHDGGSAPVLDEAALLSFAG